MYCTTLHCTTQHTFDTISNIISLIELHLSLHHNAMYCPLLVSITGTLPCQVPCNGPCNTGPISRPCGPVQARLSPTHLPPQARGCWSSRCPCCKTKKCHSTNPPLLSQGLKRGGHSVPALEQSDTLGRRRALGQALGLVQPFTRANIGYQDFWDKSLGWFLGFQSSTLATGRQIEKKP